MQQWALPTSWTQTLNANQHWLQRADVKTDRWVKSWIQRKKICSCLRWQRWFHAGPSELTKLQRLRRNSNYFWHGLSTMTSHTHHSLSLVTAYSMERVSRRLTYRPLWTLLCIISRDHTLEFVVGVSLHVERYSSNILLWSCLSHIRPSLFVMFSASLAFSQCVLSSMYVVQLVQLVRACRPRSNHGAFSFRSADHAPNY